MLQLKPSHTGGICQNPIALIAPICASLCLHLLLAGVVWFYSHHPDKVVWIDMLEVKMITPVTRSDTSHETTGQTPLAQKSTIVSSSNSKTPLAKDILPRQPVAPTPRPAATVSKLTETPARPEKFGEIVSKKTPPSTVNQQTDQLMAQNAKETTEPTEPGSNFTDVNSAVDSALNNEIQANHPIERGSATEETVEQTYVREQLDEIRKRVMDRLIYPPLARRQGWSGKVLVGFTIRIDGKIETLQVVNSSGRTLLDRQALKAVQDAEPFPPPQVAMTIVLPVVFEIETANR